MKIEITEAQAKILDAMLEDFETGYIANPSTAADRRRLRYEKCIQEISDQLTVVQARKGTNG